MTRRRLAALAVVAGLLVAAPAVLAAGALADPTPSPTPSPTAQPPENPLRVLVTSLLPRTPVKHGGIEIRGRVTNSPESATVTTVKVRLALGQRLTSRGELHDADRDRPATAATNAFVTLTPPTLAPGESGAFVLRTNVDDLALSGTGVYPLDIEARGTLPGERQQTLGLAPTWLPYFSGFTPRANKVAVLMPVVGTPQQSPSGSFLTDQLGQSVTSGRLSRVLHAAQAPPERVGCAGRSLGFAPGGTSTQAIPAPTRCEPVPLTYAIDPDLLSAVQAMAGKDGYTVGLGGRGQPGTSGAGAAAWLEGLQSSVAGNGNGLLLLPYADPDVSALTQTSAGAQDVAAAVDLGLTVGKALFPQVDPVPVAWPPDNGVTAVLTQSAADALATSANPSSTFVLDESAYAAPDDLSGRTPSARTELTGYTSSAGRPRGGLVPDADLTSLLTGTDTTCSCSAAEVGSRLAEQRFIAETAMLAAERPSQSRTFLIAPGRRDDLDVTATRAALDDLGRLPWLCPVPLAELAAQDEHCAGATSGALATPAPVDDSRGDLRTSREGLLSDSFLRSVGAQRSLATQLTKSVLDRQDAKPKDATAISELTRKLNQAVFRSESSAWREDPQGGRTQLELLTEAVTSQTSKVVVRGGKLLLTSSKGTLSVSVENGLDLPVQLRVLFKAQSPFIDAETALITVPGHSAVSAGVKADAQRSGKFVVSAQLAGRDGRPFGKVAYLNVRSTQYGRVALGLTFAAAAVLFVAAGVRIIRRSRRPPTDPAPA